MKIVAKSAIKLDQLNEKKSKGATQIELHTFESDGDRDINEIISIIKEFDLPIPIVHLPISEGYFLEDILNNYDNIEKFFNIASKIGELQNSTPIIVVHVEYKKQIYDKLGVTDKICGLLVQLLQKYTNVQVALENLQALLSDRKNNTYDLCVNAKFESAEIAEHINNTYDIKHKVGTVLDICHMVSTVRIYRDLIHNSNLEIKDYFDKFKNTLTVVHLANSIGFGLRDIDHGQPFETEDHYELLRYILKLMEDFTGYVTLEIQEDDYLNSINWLNTKNQLEMMI